jgi:hypothetical protein
MVDQPSSFLRLLLCAVLTGATILASDFAPSSPPRNCCLGAIGGTCATTQVWRQGLDRVSAMLFFPCMCLIERPVCVYLPSFNLSLSILGVETFLTDPVKIGISAAWSVWIMIGRPAVSISSLESAQVTASISRSVFAYLVSAPDRDRLTLVTTVTLWSWSTLCNWAPIALALASAIIINSFVSLRSNEASGSTVAKLRFILARASSCSALHWNFVLDPRSKVNGLTISAYFGTKDW